MAIHSIRKPGSISPHGGKPMSSRMADSCTQDYSAHFMVMEQSRDPKTRVHYPVKRTPPGGKPDPAGMEIDLWVRSKEQNAKNFPPFETFIHLYWDEVTWR